MGDAPLPPTTGLLAFGVALQPITFMTLIDTSARCLGPRSSTEMTNACRNPTTVTGYGGVVLIGLVVSMIGMVTIELLVETKLPDCGPLFDLITGGPVGNGAVDQSRVS